MSRARCLTLPEHIYSRPRTWLASPMLPQLVDAGVAALKIEGRMKSAEYVALVTGVYRAAHRSRRRSG